jgi:single-strand DNA-binding protein
VADNENTITLVGRIGQEPELRATSKGDVLNFNVATNERKRNADNTWSDGPTSWFRVSAWHDLARHGHASLHRGQQVIVRGVLTVREFQVEGGGKSKNAELRATALGHDLRWGTTTYTDGARPSSQQAGLPAAASAVESASVLQSETAPQLDAVPQRETVPAAAATGWSAPYEEETPF